MPYREKHSPKEKSIPAILTMGFLIAWGITILGGILTTNLVNKGTVLEADIIPAVVITMFAGAFVSSYIMGMIQGVKRPLIPIINGAIYFLSLLGVNALFFGGAYQGILGALLTIMGGCTISSILANIQKTQKTPYSKSMRKR
jgi:hypothetical protein